MEESLKKIYRLLFYKIISYLEKNLFLTIKLEISLLNVKVKIVKLLLFTKSNLYRNWKSLITALNLLENTFKKKLKIGFKG